MNEADKYREPSVEGAASEYKYKDERAENGRELTTEVTEGETFEDTGEICFFGGDISYGEPEEYDETPDKVKTLRSIFSMTHLSLFVYLMVSQGIATVFAFLSAVAIAAIGGGEASLGGDFALMLNIVAQYVIAFPIFFFMTKGIKRRENAEKRKLSAPSFLLILLISEGVMLVGAIISNIITYLLERALGGGIGNALDTVVNDSSLWLIILSVCVCAPVFEELMFRKIMIDRLSVFGDGVAVIFSAVAFGFFHGNLSQIIYATAVGLVFGYVYVKTRRIGYTIALHATVNFLGGVVPLGVNWLMSEIEAMQALGDGANAARLRFFSLLVSAYDVLQLMFIVGAVIALIVLIVKKKITLDGERDIELDRRTVVKVGMGNAGFVMLYSICLLLILISLFMT